MTFNWDDLSFWSSGEWDAIQEKLDDEEANGYRCCPSRINLFAALDATPFEKVRVAILGQDPYPNRHHATGVAFSVPTRQSAFPASLRNIFSEYVADLGHPYPSCGNLSPWTDRGVLLWNVYPSCREGKPGSHHWPDWDSLTQEIVEKLDETGCVAFALLGRVARNCNRYIRRSSTFTTSHPAPLGAHQGFLGSHLFSTINSMLKEPLDWRLP